MSKNHLSFEDTWNFAPADAGNDASVQVPDHTFGFDDGDPLPTAAETVTTVVTSAPKPVGTIAQLADYLVNGFWQYNNTIAHHWASSTVSYNINGLNTAEKFLAQTAMQAWSEVANITFVQTSGSANITFTHNGTMQAVTNASWFANGSISSATVNISADWITTDGGSNDGKTGIDSYGYQTYLHEIGHAIGLGHQGPYNGSASYSTNAVYANDTWQYSLMSYFAEPNYSGSSYRYVVTPQMADILAVGSIYGAPTTTRASDTVYGFNSNAGAVFSFGNYTSAPALTIYDSGGNDTLDCSGYSASQTIDLHAGAFSSVGGLINNIGIALGTTIEKAIGGTGNDTLIANDAGCTLLGGGGNDTLIGGSGADRMTGGSGGDTLTGGGSSDLFVFLLGDSPVGGQRDRITDFVSGADRIDLSGYDAISSTGSYDQFKFIATAAFNGTAGELNYAYNGSTGVTTLQGDTNGDGVADFAIDLTGNITLGVADLIGAYLVPVIVEAYGNTSLTVVGNNYALNPSGGGSGPLLKYGSVVTVGQFGAWTFIGAEQISGGYEVALHLPGTDQYTVWNTDVNGNVVSNGTGGIVSGASAALKSLEPSFQQDLNGDGVIGTVSTAVVIEAFGNTSLTLVGNNYALNPSGGGSGPLLKYGSAVTVGQYGAWTFIGAEQISGGYEVALYLPGSDQYTVWNTDVNGNVVSNGTGGIVSGASAVLKSLEPSFQQDLNGDGVIGAASSAVVIEAYGNTSLTVVGNNYALNPSGGGSGPLLKYGSAVTVGQYGAWTFIGAEQISGGYEVALYLPGSDQYTVWNTDVNGNVVSNGTGGIVSGASAALKSLEPSFQQDLNGDGIIGVAAATIIESYGNTSLTVVGNNYALNPSSGGTGPLLKYGAAVTVGQYGAWTFIGAEQISGGYEVALHLPGSDQYTVWITDTNGNVLSNGTGGIVSGSSNALKSFEPSFQQDLNGDGALGANALGNQVLEQVRQDSFVFNQQVEPATGVGQASSQEHGDQLALHGLSAVQAFDAETMRVIFDQIHQAQSGPAGPHSIDSSHPILLDHLVV